MKKPGRPQLGTPISIVFTKEQRAWLVAQMVPGGSLSAVVRDIVHAAMLSADCVTLGHDFNDLGVCVKCGVDTSDIGLHRLKRLREQRRKKK